MVKKKTATATKKKAGIKVEAKKQIRKPDFEKALDEVILKDQTAKVQEEQGPRPGAPDSLAPGATSKSDKAPKALAPVLKIPFSIWASVSQIPEMNLSDIEAQEWAEPMIDLLEYYFPGKIPEIIWIWLMFLTATEKVIDSRVKIRYEKRKERHNSQARPAHPTEPVAAQRQPAPAHNGAEPAESYPQG